MSYAELHALSNFSFLRGASSPEALVDRAAELRLGALAITDRDGLYGSVRHWLHTRRRSDGLDERRTTASLHADREHPTSPLAPSSLPPPRAIYGAELGLEDGARVVLLVRSAEGWRNLSTLLSESMVGCEKGGASLPFERLVAHQQGLWVLSGGRAGPVDRCLLGTDGAPGARKVRPRAPWSSKSAALARGTTPSAMGGGGGSSLRVAPPSDIGSLWRGRRADRLDLAQRLRRAKATLGSYRDAFGDRLIVEVQDHHQPEDRWLQSTLGGFAADLRLPVVATGGVLFATEAERDLHDVITCVRLHTTLDAAGSQLLPNRAFALRGEGEMLRAFQGQGRWVHRSMEIAEDCRFDLRDLPYQFPLAALPEGQSQDSWLAALVWRGAVTRYGARLEQDGRIRRQIEHELGVIARLGLAGYFLIVHDIVAECRRRSILCQGRGSAANSCVCFCLEITAVDPIRLQLLFERFLSEARGGWPDVDIDISNSHREEILQYVYERYGRDHAAMVANVHVYHPRSAIRDVGKVFGFGLDQVDRLAKAVDAYDGPEALIDAFSAEGENLVSEDGRRIERMLRMCQRLCGAPKHLGIHSGGFVISGTPILQSCPVENATMPGRTVLQWDKDDVAHTGLVKIDLLALGMLSVIQECTRLLRPFGLRFEMAELSYDDPLVYDLICEADTVGLFQIESRAQMNTLPRLRPRCFYDLVVEVALIRPGPIQGDMVHPYLRRRQGKEAVTYAHPLLEPILERTLGIPLFQEQAMKMAIVAAGFSGAEADKLRKVMGFKRASDEMEALFDKMVAGMVRNGFDQKTAVDVRNQLRGFAAYGFPESHAASFALIVYASAHLKRHEPAAFFAALLNNQPMGFYSPASLVHDARRHGLEVLPVCVQRSEARWSLPDLRSLRASLAQVEGWSEDVAKAVVEEREQRGPFRSIHDFCDRLLVARGGPPPIDRLQAQRLAEVGAFDVFGLDRRQALWEVAGWSPPLPLLSQRDASAPPALPPLSTGERNLLDHRLAGFSADGHPLRHLRSAFVERGWIGASSLKTTADGAPVRVVGLVITRQRPLTAKGTLFITLEDEDGFVNVVVWPKTYEQHRRMLRRTRLLGVEGRLDRSEGVLHVIGEQFHDLARSRWARISGLEAVLDTPSRDFH